MKPSFNGENRELFNFSKSGRVRQMEQLYREALIEDFIRSGNKPKTYTRTSVTKCRRCKKKLKRKHVKYIFRIFREGKAYRRTYCEDCVDELPEKTLDKMEYVGAK